jgi:hypothetical protein
MSNSLTSDGNPCRIFFHENLNADSVKMKREHLWYPEMMHQGMLLVYNAPMPDSKNENTIGKN